MVGGADPKVPAEASGEDREQDTGDHDQDGFQETHSGVSPNYSQKEYTTLFVLGKWAFKFI